MMKEIRKRWLVAILLSALFVSSVMASVGHTIDSVDSCYGGYVCVSGTCDDGTTGTLVFTSGDTWGDVNDGFETFCSVE